MKQFMLMLAALCFANAQAQNLQMLSSLYNIWDQAQSIAVSGNHVFVATRNTGVRILDVSNPSEMREIGWIDEIGPVSGIAASGNYAYTSSETDGFIVLNVANPHNITIVGSMPLGHVSEMVVVGDHGYVTMPYSEVGFQIINVSIPSQPYLEGNLMTGSGVIGIDVSGNYAYLCGMCILLKIVDISDPANPLPVSELVTSESISGVKVEGQYAYVIEQSTGLRVLNISNPLNPVEVGTCQINDAYNVTASGNYAYVSSEFGGIHSVDISNPTNPQLLDYYDLPGQGWDIGLMNNTAYLTNGSGISAINVTNPQNLSESGNYLTVGYPVDVAVSGGYACLAFYLNGLRIVDVTNPFGPHEVGVLDLPGGTVDLTVEGNYAYMACSCWGLRVVDISDPYNPVQVGEWSWYDANAVKVCGGYAYVSSASEFAIVDIADPTNPIHTGVLLFTTYTVIEDVAVSGNYAYLADDYVGLRIVDISDPENPFEAISPLIGVGVITVAVNGEYCYVTGQDSLYVFNISDPLNPVMVNQEYLGFECSDLCFAQSYLFATAFQQGLQLFSMVNPEQPQLVVSYDTNGDAMGVDVSGQYVYVADRYSFDVLECSTSPVQPIPKAADWSIALNNNPNPFNPATAIRYYLPVLSKVNLSVYDVSGRLVANLANEIQEAGQHTVRFDGSSLASGIYFAKLDAGKTRAVQKMVLVK